MTRRSFFFIQSQLLVTTGDEKEISFEELGGEKRAAGNREQSGMRPFAVAEVMKSFTQPGDQVVLTCEQGQGQHCAVRQVAAELFADIGALDVQLQPGRLALPLGRVWRIGRDNPDMGDAALFGK